jgi:hypothetical protein
MRQLNQILIHVTKSQTVRLLSCNAIWENEMGKEYSTHDIRYIHTEF